VSFITENWTLIALVLASGAMLMWPAMSAGGGKNGLNANEAVQLMNREKAVIVDVCNADEYAAGHILAAKNIPVDRLATDLPLQVKNKALPLLIVCASGIRSGKAAAAAIKLGYEKVYTLRGGMGAWRSANLPVEKA